MHAWVGAGSCDSKMVWWPTNYMKFVLTSNLNHGICLCSLDVISNVEWKTSMVTNNVTRR